MQSFDGIFWELVNSVVGDIIPVPLTGYGKTQMRYLKVLNKKELQMGLTKLHTTETEAKKDNKVGYKIELKAEGD